MGYANLEPKDIEQVLNSEHKLKLFLDSNVLIAYLDKEHEFNYVAQAIIEPLKDKNCYFFLHYIVVGEVINKWVQLKHTSVKQAISLVWKFIDSLKYSLSGGRPMRMELVMDSFNKHSRHVKFIKAHFNDFILLVEAEMIKNIKIITCDQNMYDAAKSIFKKNVYYLPFNSSKKRSELSRFIKDMELIDL